MNNLIEKWRVLAILNNIKNWINTNRDKEELIQIIDSYINFISNIDDSKGD